MCVNLKFVSHLQISWFSVTVGDLRTIIKLRFNLHLADCWSVNWAKLKDIAVFQPQQFTSFKFSCTCIYSLAHKCLVTQTHSVVTRLLCDLILSSKLHVHWLQLVVFFVVFSFCSHCFSFLSLSDIKLLKYINKSHKTQHRRSYLCVHFYKHPCINMDVQQQIILLHFFCFVPSVLLNMSLFVKKCDLNFDMLKLSVYFWLELNRKKECFLSFLCVLLTLLCVSNSYLF